MTHGGTALASYKSEGSEEKMKNKIMSAKFMITGLVFASAFVVAGTLRDMRLYSDSFMADEEVVFVSSVDDSYQRVVASFVAKPKRRIAIFPVALSKSSLINGQWEITKILNNKGEAVYDKINSAKDKLSEIKANFKLLKKSTVQIDDDKEQIFKTSYLTEFGTLTLFKEVGNGYEIIEARKIKKEVVVPTNSYSTRNSEVAKANSQVKGLMTKVDGDLTLVSALDPARSRVVVKGDKISGSAYVSNGELIVEDLKLHIGDKNETTAWSFESRIGDGGVVKVYDDNGRMVNAMVTNNGDKGYNLRFVTGGPLQGAILNFVTADELERISAVQEKDRFKKEEANELAAEKKAEAEELAAERKAEAAELAAERKAEEEELAAERKAEESEETYEEVVQKVKDRGFNFSAGSETNNRKLASEK